MARPTVSTTFTAVDRVSNKLRGMQKNVTGFSRHTQRSFSGIGQKIMRMRGLLVGAGAAIAGGKLAQGITNFTSQGDDIAKTARQIGIASDALQTLRFAADRQGVSTKNLDKSLKAMNNRLGKLRTGQGELNTMLKETNPELLAQLKATDDSEEAFMLLMNAMNEAGSAAERTALAQAAFSSSGRELVRMSEAGVEGLRKLQQQAEELGLVISEDTLAASEKFRDGMTNLKAVTRGVIQSALAPMIPKLAQMVQKISDFVKLHKDEIQDKIETTFKKIKSAVLTVVRVVKALAPLIKTLVITFIAWKGAILLVSGVMLGLRAIMAIQHFMKFIRVIRTIIRVKKGWAAVQSILNLVMKANPIGVIITAIGVLIGLIITLVKNWETVKRVFLTVTKAIGDAIVSVFQWAIGIAKKIFFTFADYILSTLGNIIKAVLNAGSAFAKVLGIDTSGLDKVIGKLSELQKNVREQSAIGDLIGDAGTGTTLIGRNDGQIQRSESVSRSEVDINIAGMPQGSTTRQRGRAPGVRLNLGEAGGL